MPSQSAIFGAPMRVWRSDETSVAAEIPTLVTSYFPASSRMTSEIVEVKALPPLLGVSRRVLSKISPAKFTTPPRTLVPPISTPILSKKLSFNLLLQLVQG